MFELISKFFRRSPSPELPACELDLILKKLSYDELRLIFDFLSLKERVKCRRVCKAFRSVVDSIRVRELFVFELDWNGELKWYLKAWWFHSARPVHSKNSVNVRESYWTYYCLGFQSIGHHLKFLSLRGELEIKILSEQLRSFVELEELWILEVNGYSSDPKVTLRHPNLKKIAFSLYPYSENCSERPSVVLDTPSLEDVRVERNLQRVQFKFGASVKCLQIDKCERTYEMLDQFMELKNLERFSCTDPAFLKEFDVLKFKPDLKRIDCHRHESGKQFDVKRLIERLLEQKAKWNLPVEIYFEGQLVNDTFDLRKLKLRNDA